MTLHLIISKGKDEGKISAAQMTKYLIGPYIHAVKWSVIVNISITDKNG